MGATYGQNTGTLGLKDIHGVQKVRRTEDWHQRCCPLFGMGEVYRGMAGPVEDILDLPSSMINPIHDGNWYRLDITPGHVIV